MANQLYWLGKGTLGKKIGYGDEINPKDFDEKRLAALQKQGLVGEKVVAPRSGKPANEALKDALAENKRLQSENEKLKKAEK